MNFNQLTTDMSKHAARKKLSGLIDELPVVHLSGPLDVGVRAITADSRQVNDRTLFVALEGEHQDGHRYVQRAIEQGASVVVIQRKQYEAHLSHLVTAAYSQRNQTAVVIVENTRTAFAHLADRFFDSPSKRLRLIGITGTNGKTTTSFLIKSILESTGEKVGLIGTIEYHIGNDVYPADFTTPYPDTLHGLFSAMVNADCTSVVMEVSSHALALERVHGLTFDVSLFTNLTQDHLDFHRTIENYRAAKKLLFDLYTKSTSVFNADDEASYFLAHDTISRKFFYGVTYTNDVVMKEISLSSSATNIILQTAGAEVKITSPLIGRFNAYNLTAAFSVACALRIKQEDIVRGLENVKAIPGRFEQIISMRGVTAIVDYSHTPDSLQKCLDAIREIFARRDTKEKIITVFGCGGDRDRTKRPIMGRIAEQLSDHVFVTSDNPRTEDPQSIIDEIVRGMKTPSRARAHVDRCMIIEEALASAQRGDVVLVAGKGHESYQIIGNQKLHFDDREIIRQFFLAHDGGVYA